MNPGSLFQSSLTRKRKSFLLGEENTPNQRTKMVLLEGDAETYSIHFLFITDEETEAWIFWPLGHMRN